MLACGNARALSLEFDQDTESSDIRAAVLQWSNDALAKLPPGMHERFPGKIRVRFQSWGKAATLTEPHCSDGSARDGASNDPLFETYGRYNALRKIIYLNAQLRDEILLGPDGTRNFNC